MASAATPSTLGGRLARLVLSLATALTLLGLSIAPFFSPQWIHGEQARAGASVPGYAGDAVQSATDSTVAAVLAPTGDFTFLVHGSQFFDDREVAHMEDVRRVFAGLAGAILASLLALILAVLATRGAPARRAGLWRAVGRGATWLAGFMVVVGVLSVVAFDAMFQAFHELLFPAGSFTFDPAKERLVQLFPDQFWSDTSLALGVVAVVLSIVVVVVARRRAARLRDAAPTDVARGVSPAVHDGSAA